MRADQFCEAVRSTGGRALLTLAECFEPPHDADGAPALFCISPEQTKAARQAITALQDMIRNPDLVPNAQAMRARDRQSAARGRPPNPGAARLY